MKVKEAMEIGIHKAPIKARGLYFDGATSACAMGTLSLGVGSQYAYYDVFIVNKLFPFLSKQLDEYPESRNSLAIDLENCGLSIEGVVLLLNDSDKGISREAIAEWLSLVEKEHACQARP